MRPIPMVVSAHLIVFEPAFLENQEDGQQVLGDALGQPFLALDDLPGCLGVPLW